MKSTKEMRDRCRELSVPNRDDYDRAVICILDDFETAQYFRLPDGKIVSFNPGGRWHGWVWSFHPDGQMVSEAKLEPFDPHKEVADSNEFTFLDGPYVGGKINGG